MIHIEKQEVCNLDHWVSENSERPLMLPATRKTQHPNKFRKVRINFLKLHNEGRNFFHTDPSASIHLLGLVCAKKTSFKKYADGNRDMKLGKVYHVFSTHFKENYFSHLKFIPFPLQR